jgi:phage tail-like protein
MAPIRPFSAFRFQVTFSGGDPADPVADAGFADVQGLEASVEVKAHPEGGLFQGVRQLVGRATFQNIVLKRGMTANLELWRWFTNVANGVHPVSRKEVLIELLDVDKPTAVARWNVTRAVPIKMRVSDLSGKSTELAIEEMHLAHEGWQMDLTVGSGGR